MENAAGLTYRTDKWWIQPISVLVGLGAFVVYATWAGMQGTYYYFDPYLSPFYSPLLFVKEGVPGGAPLSHAWFGSWPGWWPDFFLIPASPAIFILLIVGPFRLTCYYYRKAYYRAFTWTPPACAVGSIHRKNYEGETKLLLFQNLHRFTLYFAIIIIFILFYDAYHSFFYKGKFGIGVGSIILLITPILLACYTFGCHSLRHLVGGGSDCFSCSKVRYGAWKKVTFLNERHQLFAWLSLFAVGLADIYVRLVSMGIIHDFNTW